MSDTNTNNFTPIGDVIHKRIQESDEPAKNGTVSEANADEHAAKTFEPREATLVSIPEETLQVLKQTLTEVVEKAKNALALLPGHLSATGFIKDTEALGDDFVPQGRTVEGVFDGEHMIAGDGKKYSVPPNYASKSKLVEGDLLKLTITPAGAFIYKQIGPIERARLTGELVYNQDTGEWGVLADGRVYKVLKASATFFKGNTGDEVVILVPRAAPSKWGAVENIIRKEQR